MFSIRRYEGCAIDLWVGDHREFACDQIVALDEAEQQCSPKVRHLAITNDDEKHIDLIEIVKKARKGYPAMQRLTFIFDNIAAHNKAAEALARELPEQT